MLKSISVTEVKPGAQGVIVDVRSEGEFVDAHIPGATNISLLNDAERAEVGTLYKRQGAADARRRGLEIVRPKLENLLMRIAEAAGLKSDQVTRPNEDQWSEAFRLVSRETLEMDFEEQDLKANGGAVTDDVQQGARAEQGSSGRPPEFKILIKQPRHSKIAFYCWRGGARSKSMTLFAQALGFDCCYIDGGHKAFRNEVLRFLENEKYPFKLCTLYGLTGSGKTDIIRQWLKEGKPVIDLEALAHHRGSAFGQVGIDIRGRQKDFENNLFWEMQKLAGRHEKRVVVEGESRRIGYVQLPEAFMTAMSEGTRIKVAIQMEERVQNILREYVDAIDEERMVREARYALEAIKRRLGGEKHKELSLLLDIRDYSAFTEQLLVHYYDKTYQHAREPSTFYHGEISSASDWDRLKSLGSF